MKIVGILKERNGFFYIRCNEGEYPVDLIDGFLQMLSASVNLTVSATVDFDRPYHTEEFDFWLKDDLELFTAY